MTQSEALLPTTTETVANERMLSRLFKFGFFIAVGIAMMGWLSFLGWLAIKIFGL